MKKKKGNIYGAVKTEQRLYGGAWIGPDLFSRRARTASMILITVITAPPAPEGGDGLPSKPMALDMTGLFRNLLFSSAPRQSVCSTDDRGRSGGHWVTRIGDDSRLFQQTLKSSDNVSGLFWFGGEKNSSTSDQSLRYVTGKIVTVIMIARHFQWFFDFFRTLTVDI